MIVRVVAKSIIERLESFHVQILIEEDSLDFLVPAPGISGRPSRNGCVEVAYEDGAIRELEDLVHSLPSLKCAVISEIASKDAVG